MAVFKMVFTTAVKADTAEAAEDLFDRYVASTGIHEAITENMSVSEIKDPADPYMDYPLTESDV